MGIINKGNPSSCERLGNGSKIADCKKAVIIENAIRSGDPSKCKAGAVDRDSEERCKSQVGTNLALKEKNTSACDKIGDSKAKALCKVVVLTNEAYASGDSKFCDKIEDKDSKVACKDNVMLLTAKHSKDSLACAKIVNPEIKASCQRQTKK